MAIESEELEAEVWAEFYQPLVTSAATELGVSLTVCYLLWQVFNRLADEQFYPPSLPYIDLQKVLSKTSKFFDKDSSKYNAPHNTDSAPMQYNEFLRIIWNEAKDEVKYKTLVIPHFFLIFNVLCEISRCFIDDLK